MRFMHIHSHERFSDRFNELRVVHVIGLSKLIRKNDGINEYVAVYVDDLEFAMNNPKSFVDALSTKHAFNSKSTRLLEMFIRYLM